MDSATRLNKFLAQNGYASRRGADALITAGKVFVNGTRAVLGQTVTPSDKVEIKGMSEENLSYILYYKPQGLLTQKSEPTEHDIASRIKKDHKITGVFPIGRLDKDAEGLILLTNDGRVTKSILELPQTYEVTLDKRIPQTFINRIRKGVRLDSYMTGEADAALSTQNERVFTITLHEGRKYHIRRMCATLGYQVQNLKRVGIGAFTLKNLKSGGFHRLTQKEIGFLQKNFNLK